MLNSIYTFLHKFTIFLVLRDFLLYIFSFKKIDKIVHKNIYIITSVIPFYKMKQRPQQLSQSLANLNNNKIIIYYEIDFGRIKSSYERRGNLVITNSLFLLRKELINKNIEVLATGNIRIPKLLSFLNIYFDKIIYDYYDNFDGYNNYLYKEFLNGLSQYNKIICSAKLLEDQLRSNNYTNIQYLPNGVNSKDWLNIDKDILKEVKSKYFSLGKKIVGFYGGIEEWLDYDLIKYIVANNNNLDFVFIGPDKGGFLKNNGILEFENFTYFGYIGFDKLKYYSYFFDIAIIPFKINSITDAVSPVKFFEYLIQGKPVVTTGFKEILLHSDYCFIGKNKKDFNLQIDNALIKSSDEIYVEKIKKYSNNFEWNNLVKNIF